MLGYCIKRVLAVFLVLLGISLLTFLMSVFSPGDPAEIVLNQNGFNDPTPEQIQAMRIELGMNRSLVVQYCTWLGKVLQGDLGHSYITGKPIFQELVARTIITMQLTIYAITFTAIGGIILGILAAIYHDRKIDRIIKSFTNAMLAIPGFWLALILILCFSEKLQVLPTSGTGTYLHMLMPALVVSFSAMATVCRFMRSALLFEFSKQYFWVANTRGISSWKLICCEALPNAIVPVIALLGNYLGNMLGGSVIAESIFALPGLGSLAIEAVRMRDYPVLQAYVLLTGVLLVSTTLVVDLLLAYLHPKIKFGDSNL